MVRIIIHGCNGNMGQVVARSIEASPDMEVAAGIDTAKDAHKNPFPVYTKLSECDHPADVIVDFSSPEALPALLEGSVQKKIALIIATTGHTEEDRSLIREKANLIPIFTSANMSLGVNLMSELIYRAATVLGNDYDIEIIEKHHNRKKDAPSGTAYALADSINSAFLQSKNYVFGRHSRTEKRSVNEIGIHAVRAGTIVGEHQVLFAGKDEVLGITHSAYSRQIFASGVLKAARYIMGKPAGFYTMKDMITEQSAVTHLYTGEDEALVSINRVPYNTEQIAAIFKRIGEENINIDMISQTAPANDEVNISFTLSRKDLGRTIQLIRGFQEMLPNLWMDIMEDIIKVTVEGVGMEKQSGVAARVFEVLAGLKVKIKSVTTSETKISYIIDQKDVPKAVEAIKRAFEI